MDLAELSICNSTLQANAGCVGSIAAVLMSDSFVASSEVVASAVDEEIEEEERDERNPFKLVGAARMQPNVRQKIKKTKILEDIVDCRLLLHSEVV